MENNNRLFSGRGDQQTQQYHNLPEVDPKKLVSPDKYLASAGLASAVETALTLGMPLLLTGEPGCGKSQLAFRIAWELGFPGEKPIRFPVKSTTEARDLFYTFDTVGRFHAAQNRDGNANQGHNDAAAENFITYQALGLAILQAKGVEGRTRIDSSRPIVNPYQASRLDEKPRRSVVLLDEIDKAPRDVPNDILNEIESLEFNVPELGLFDPIQLGEEENPYRPVIIITSNSERDLPDAFLRRCVYFNLGFPQFSADDPEEISVEKIVYSRFGQRYTENSRLVKHALELVAKLREDTTDLNKPPSIAEILNWLDYLKKLQEGSRIPLDDMQGLEQLEPSLLEETVKTTLLKTSEDQARAAELIAQCLDTKPRSKAGS